MAIHKPSEAFERLFPPKEPNPHDKRFSNFKLARMIGGATIDYGLYEPDKVLVTPLPPAESPIFPVVIDTAVSKKLPHGYRMRSLQRDDFQKGYPSLRTIGEIDAQGWDERCEYMRTRTDVYSVLVITDRHGTVCCTGTLVLERKLAHGMAIVGHIQDIVVADGQRGKNLGYRMLDQLDRLAYAAGATRTVASTQMTNMPFYKQKSYKHTGVEMTRSFLRIVTNAPAEEEGRKSRSSSPERIERERALTAARLSEPVDLPESSEVDGIPEGLIEEASTTTPPKEETLATPAKEGEAD